MESVKSVLLLQYKRLESLRCEWPYLPQNLCLDNRDRIAIPAERSNGCIRNVVGVIPPRRCTGSSGYLYVSCIRSPTGCPHRRNPPCRTGSRSHLTNSQWPDMMNTCTMTWMRIVTPWRRPPSPSWLSRFAQQVPACLCLRARACMEVDVFACPRASQAVSRRAHDWYARQTRQCLRLCAQLFSCASRWFGLTGGAYMTCKPKTVWGHGSAGRGCWDLLCRDG